MTATNKVASVKAAAQPDSLGVKRLAVVDDKGTERIVIAAPLPDPIISGKRVKRDGADPFVAPASRAQWVERMDT